MNIVFSERENKNFLIRMCVLVLVIALALGCALPVHGVSPLNSTTYLRTSISETNYLELSINRDELTVSGVIDMPGLTDIMVQYGSDTAANVSISSGDYFSVTSSLLSVSNATPISIYLNLKSERSYWSYIWNRIYVEKRGSSWYFLTSPVYENNREFLDEWLDPEDYLGDEIAPEVKKLSDQIVGGETDDYQKVFLLHKWVAENIYYDYDCYYNGTETTYSPEEIIVSKRSVCEGYANLLRELIRAQRIPAMKTSTYALGVSASGGSFAVKTALAQTEESNHAHVEAFVRGRWIILDATWDSNNRYENGVYVYKQPTGYYYFDISPEAFALDHKIISRGDWRLARRDGTVVNTDVWKHGKEPSSWAEGEVELAYRAGLVPSGLMRNFRSGISRSDLAEILSRLLDKVYDADPVKGSAVFEDTENPDVLRAANLGIINGYEQPDGTYLFKPANTLKRGEMAAVINRVAKLCGQTVSGFDSEITFADTSSHWCRSELGWPVHSGIVKGTSDTAFSPDSTLTVEQTIIMIYRAYKALK